MSTRRKRPAKRPARGESSRTAGTTGKRAKVKRAAKGTAKGAVRKTRGAAKAAAKRGKAAPSAVAKVAGRVATVATRIARTATRTATRVVGRDGGGDGRAGRGANARPQLRALADRLGIIDEYVDQTGKERRRTSDATRELLLGAMGIDATSEAAAKAALDALEAREAAAGLAPVRVLEQARLREGIPLARATEWTMELRLEDGTVRTLAGRARAGRGKPATIALPDHLPQGYHDVRLVLRGADGEREATQRLIVVPSRCPQPEVLLQGERVFGITANLYTVRSERNWGVGDCTDLGALLEWTAEVGGAFVGVNPLHALRNRGGDVSPYSPVSRVFRNVLYIDPEAVPELGESDEARERCDARETRTALAGLRAGDRVDYERVMRVKLPALEALHRTFARLHRDRDTARGRAYAAWLQQQGGAVDDWATFCVLEEHFAARAGLAARWRDWPREFQDPRGPAVREFRERHAEQVDLHRWLQFELDRQLGEAARRGRRAGLPVGLYQDLAIGAAPDGSDTWLEPALFVRGASVGAPPDPYSATGQNWGLPPLDPRALAEGRYEYWVRLLRAAMRHAGALRIDHVMGLFRQFWIPEGKSGTEGAYVRFPADDLLGILALEATRANAIVVGEDLGTVPPDVPPAMRKWGLLSSKVLYFERDARGGFRQAKDYDADALATANTHDLATLAGFWQGRDIALRREAGLIRDAKAEKRERAARDDDKGALVALLREEGTLPSNETPERDVAMRAAVHAFMRRTPSWLVGLSLDDIIGELEPVNLPGVGPDRFPSWTRRLSLPLERLRESRDVRRALGVERWWVGGSSGLRPETGRDETRRRD